MFDSVKPSQTPYLDRVLMKLGGQINLKGITVPIKRSFCQYEKGLGQIDGFRKHRRKPHT